jgi:hypothetical protein
MITDDDEKAKASGVGSFRREPDTKTRTRDDTMMMEGVNCS